MKFSSLVQAAALLAAQALADASSTSLSCRCLPGDACWPSDRTWAKLNATVGGRLVATVPIGSPCHDPTYDAAACAALQASWKNPLTHVSSSSSVMGAYFANQSCDPFTNRSKPCLLGNYVSYAVKVKNTADVAVALRFAKEHNLRIVVRNTGHDFFGRSTGAGALAIWTQGLKTVSFVDWTDDHYTGPAAIVGAGVLGYEIVEAAHKQGLTVVGGECATVGLAGGFIQGGGHSALSTTFGLATDHTLAFQVVTTSGLTVTASPTQNADLYWALSGGGGGNYGVVVGVTIRAHKAATVGGAAFQLLAPTTTPEKFQAAVAKFYELLPKMIDNGAMVSFHTNQQMLKVKPVTIWNSTAAYVRDVVLQPFTTALTEIGISLPVTYSELSYRDHYDRYMGPLPQGSFEVESHQFGGRLIPRKVLEDRTSRNSFVRAVNNLTANGILTIGSAAAYSNKPAGSPNNSVNPVWRSTLIQLQLMTNWNTTAPWSEMEAVQRRMTEEFMPQIESVTPDSGSYLNEADFRQPNWQQTFYGSSYEKLLAIKRKWDPESVLYALKGVGSEAWNVGNDGRMCRA
ncbi:hypothetical protein JDV02_004173 [Purpureocillium takamizusanense]|uniref:FAD-binding PCMH-type domain-containing protein n=1 Tax=Purpureocillium takamizusanense TaxID=2060973 RepID=A0A9Q8QBZ1_9HYPO|nr:uncharacterized protein JDV02_004173 [Purpureocillium takamizusanense]UNI17859.1 hypothetical protein JDV02_004173 [Purpureocillium takamizusanense]